MLDKLNHQTTVLVTGGCGFIGSHLVESLINQGYHVRILDNLSTGKLDHIQHLSTAKIEFIQGDIRDEETVNQAVRGCKYIFHEAAVVSVPQSIQDPINTSKVNYGGTINVLEAASQHRVQRVIFASSAAIYGEEPTLPKQELMPPQPITPYGIDKYSSELVGQYYARAGKIEFVALRYFNVFGIRQDPSSPYSGVISLFCNCFAQNRPPSIYGDGLQTRDFINVADVVAANLTVMLHPDVSGQAFNVGRGQSSSILDIVNILNDRTQSQHIPSFQPARPGDIRHSLADISRLQKLGWEPQVSLEQGLGDLL
jgi:UDP-glucose 4-epimerase